MNKKTKRKSSKKSKPKIDVVLESLLNLEQKVKELIKEVNQLKNKNPYYDVPLAPIPTTDNPCSVSYSSNLAADINRAIN